MDLLDEKLKQLDSHYISDTNTDILGRISVINKIKPMEDSKINIEVEGFKNLLKDELKTDNDSKKNNFLIRFILYIKNKITNIGK